MTDQPNRSARSRTFVEIGALALFLLVDGGLAIQLLRDRDAGVEREANRSQEINSVLSEVEQQRQRASDLTDQSEAIVAALGGANADRPKTNPGAAPDQPQPRPAP
jgi:hypothetical protein